MDSKEMIDDNHDKEVVKNNLDKEMIEDNHDEVNETPQSTKESEMLTSWWQRMDKKKLGRHLLFPAMFCYLELIFHLLVFRTIDGNILFPFLFAFACGLIVNFWTSCFTKKINSVISFVALTIACISFGTQLVYHHIFKTFLSIYSVGENGADVMEFWKDAVNGIIAVLPGLIFLLLPIPVLALILKNWISLERETMREAFLPLGGAVVIHIVALISLVILGTGAHTPYDLYHTTSLMDLSAQKLGLLTATRKDISNVIIGEDELSLDHDAFLQTVVPSVTPIVTVIPTEVPDSNASNATVSEKPIVTLAPTEAPIDRSPNVLNIDFNQLAEEESKETIKTLHTYFSMTNPTNKNEYTGMFEGYNLIFLTAEGFSPWAVDEEVTPTLYRLTHEGFVFENFYTPIWYTSTSDGEYVACTGLIPSGTNSFSKSSSNALPFCFGWQFQNIGYSTRAYHNHSYTYYNRHLTHPNMGYDYKGAKGGGLEVELTWPESDLEMMEKTVPEFINDEKFHVYYMTVSGHLQYTFFGNSMASKNKAYVENLPYSENIKAYIASQKELDLALEYLIQELKKAGVLDKTVIALSADHYPYGLTNEEISEVAGHTIEENFELYKNNFILWNSAMEEPIVVDKYCSSLDIMPTLSNLFGLEYDSRLFMGQDILSDSAPLVMFSNQSFITDQIKYNSKTGEVEKLTDAELPEDYLKKNISVVRNKFNVSASILKNDYFSYMLPYLAK